MSTSSNGQKATDSINGKLTFEQDKNRIVGRDENNVIRMIILANGSDFLMKISKEGFDALVADNDQLIFNSSQNIFKIVDTGSGTFPNATATLGSGGGWNMDIQNTFIPLPPDIDYVPIVIANIEFPLSEYSLTPVQITEVPSSSEVHFISFNVISTPTDIVATTSLTINSNAAVSVVRGGWPFTYYLLQESAA